MMNLCNGRARGSLMLFKVTQYQATYKEGIKFLTENSPQDILKNHIKLAVLLRPVIYVRHGPISLVILSITRQ